MSWTKDGRAIVIAVKQGDTIALSEQDLETGRLRPLTTLPQRDFWGFTTLPGGGVMIGSPIAPTISLRGIPGRADTVFALPDTGGSINNFAPSPDGKAMVIVGWDRNFDSIMVRRVDLTTMKMTRLWSVYADGSQAPSWLRDGSIILQIKENASTLIWYRIPAAGGPPVRLGTPPRAADASFIISMDGRRVIARVNTQNRDIHLIRNFRQLLGE
jgi:hypothetical protein